jgi:hypothetical protein
MKLTRIERRRLGRGRCRWRRSRGREVLFHPRHDALDTIKGVRGLALPLSTIVGRPKCGASDVGAWTDVWVPIGRHPRDLPLYILLVQVLRPGGSLVVVNHRRVESGGQTATVTRPMLVPRRDGTSHVGLRPDERRALRRTFDGSSNPLLGRDPRRGHLAGLVADQGLNSSGPMASLAAGLGPCRIRPMGLVAHRGHVGIRLSRMRVVVGRPPGRTTRTKGRMI